MRRYASYGPTDRYPPAPGAGMCISVFAVIRREGRLLMGVPRDKKKWIAEWVPNWGFYSEKDLRSEFRRWRLPSGYLLEGEHPDAAVERVVRDQLRVDPSPPSARTVLSYSTPSDWYPGNDHWDLVFVYELGVGGPIVRPPWWKELRFLTRSELDGADLGWNDDLMRDLGLVSRR